MKIRRTSLVEYLSRSARGSGSERDCVQQLRDQPQQYCDACRIEKVEPDFYAKAFTLIEIMVVVVLLSLIILGLLLMFDQTEKAFRAGTAQTDQLEAGRMFNDFLIRDMEQIVPTGQSNAVNFWAKLANYGGLQPSQQTLPPGATRTNLLQDLYFVSQANQTLSGVGYFVRTNPGIGGNVDLVGTLYRFQTNIPVGLFNSNPHWAFDSLFTATNGTNASGPVSKMLDGVVEFRVHCYDTNGNLLNEFSPFNYTSNSVGIIDWQSPIGPIPSEIQFYTFSNRIVPAYVEVQLGILEPAVLKRYRSIPSAVTRASFLANHAGNVQLFRQRIPIRNVDPSAY
jgi:prepilin-type N-terminal cleavage/methylation domain-containing protein